MKQITLDLETTVRNKGENAVGGFSGSPYAAQNFPVVVAERAKLVSEQRMNRLTYAVDRALQEPPLSLQLAAKGTKVLIIGHNLGFDLVYLMKEWPELWDKALPSIWIWDTQQAEYLISGQSELYPSLDEASEKRGLPLKDNRMKAYWAEGLDTTEIPKEELLEYAAQDVENTDIVFQDQWRELQDDPMLLELAKVKMDDILLTTHMQFFGMQFDLKRAAQLVAELDKELETVHNEVVEDAQPYMPKGFTFNPGSPEQLSALLFGGVIKMEVDVEVMKDGEPVIFKSGLRKGKVKTRKEKIEVPIAGMKLSPKGIPNTTKGYSTGDEHLQKLKGKTELVDKVLRYRELTKDAETYYRGYAALVWPDGAIHPSINHESTVTGRQSVAQPNLQNTVGGDD